MKAIKPVPLRNLKVTLGNPVVVSMAAPDEHTWGYWQFPAVSRMPGGELLYTINITQDDDLCYGHGGVSWLSHDDGCTWHAADIDEKSLTISHSPIGEVHNSEFLCVPMNPGMRAHTLSSETLGKPVGRFFSYAWRSFYPLDRFPREIRDYYQNLRGFRWSPKTRQWDAQRVKWDVKGALLRIEEEGMVGSGFNNTSLEQRPVLMGKELIYVDYRIAYRLDDGSAPNSWQVHCFVSKDNGKSWQRRGLVGAATKDDAGPTESCAAVTSRGDLVCVSRTTDHRQLPMLVYYSKDRGKTWTKPVSLFDHGVLPTLMNLDNGVMVLSYGRPGVHLSFSPRGDGRQWKKPVEVLPTGLPKGKSAQWNWNNDILFNKGGTNEIQKDGYTSLLALGPNRFLIAYTDVRYRDARGRIRKAAMVREVTVDCT